MNAKDICPNQTCLTSLLLLSLRNLNKGDQSYRMDHLEVMWAILVKRSGFFLRKHLWNKEGLQQLHPDFTLKIKLWKTSCCVKYKEYLHKLSDVNTTNNIKYK